MNQATTEIDRTRIVGESLRRPLRVFHLIKNLNRGGAETLLVESLRFVDRERFTYGFGYMLPGQDLLAAKLRDHGARVTCFETRSSPSLLLSARRIARHLREWDADVLHCHLPLVGVVGRLAGVLAGVPVVYTEHNIWERYHPATRLVNRLTWRLQNQVVAVSGEVAESIRSGTGAAVPVQVVLNGVDVDRFSRDAADGTGVREELGIAPDAPVVGTVAIFKAQKRLEEWLRVARMVADERQDARFIVVGDGPQREELRGLARSLDLEDVVHFVGLKDDVRPYLAVIDVYLMSSIFEGLPVAVLEAMAMECAVVSTAVGGIPELVTNCSNGLLVPVERPEALGPAVLRLISDSGLRREYARRGREIVIEGFSMHRMVRELEALYRKVVECRGEATLPSRELRVVE